MTRCSAILLNLIDASLVVWYEILLSVTLCNKNTILSLIKINTQSLNLSKCWLGFKYIVSLVLISGLIGTCLFLATVFKTYDNPFGTTLSKIWSVYESVLNEYS